MGKKSFFIQSFDNIGEKETDLHLSDYNHTKVKKLPKISPLRWATLVDGALTPGKGFGTLIIGELEFKVAYAWGGRMKPKGGWNDRTSYTTRIEADSEKISKLVNQIIIDECGALDYQISYKESFRNWNPEIKGPTTYRNYLKKRRDEIIRNKSSMVKSGKIAPIPLYYTDKKIEKMVKDFAKKWKNPKATIKQNHLMEDIETDQLGKKVISENTKK